MPEPLIFSRIEEEDALDLFDHADHENLPPPKRLREDHGCDVCSLSFPERRTLVRHLKTIGHCRKAGLPTRGFNCPICGRGFARDDTRRRHEQEVHCNVKRPKAWNLLASSVETGENDNNMGPAFETSAAYYQPALDCDTVGLQWTLSPSEDLAGLPTQLRELSPGSLPSAETVGNLESCPSLIGSGVSTLSTILTQSSSSPNAQHLYSESSDIFEAGKPTGRSERLQGKDLLARPGSAKSSHSGWLQQPLQLLLLRDQGSLMKNGASLRPHRLKPHPPCTLCRKSLGRSEHEVRYHMERHFQEFSTQHVCQACNIGFARKEDLKLHLQSAVNRFCGYNFAHNSPCTGHHPEETTAALSDHDRLRLCIGLRHWEQAQLQAYMVAVDEVLQDINRHSGECWSVGGGRAGSVFSLSTLFSRMEVESTPDHIDYSARKDANAVRIRMAERLACGSRMQMLPITRLRPPVGAHQTTLDTFLSHAAKRGSTLEAKSLLLAGANVDGRHSTCAATPLTFALFNGRANTVRLLLQHGARLNYPILLPEVSDYRTIKYLTRLRAIATASENVSPSAPALDSFYTAPITAAGEFGMGGGIDSKDGCFSLMNAQSDLGMYHEIIVRGIHSEHDRRASGCRDAAMVIGDGDLDSDYYLPPSAVVDAFDLKDLPNAIALWYLVNAGHAEVIDAFCRQKAFRDELHDVLRLAASHNRSERLSQLLIKSKVAAEIISTSSSILEAAALAMSDETVDVLLSHVSRDCIRSVLSGAIERNRKDVVVMLCSKTSAGDNPIDRWYEHSSMIWLSSGERKEDSAAVCGKESLDQSAIYVLLATSSLVEQYGVIERLVRSGVSEATVLQVLGRVCDFEPTDAACPWGDIEPPSPTEGLAGGQFWNVQRPGYWPMF